MAYVKKADRPIDDTTNIEETVVETVETKKENTIEKNDSADPRDIEIASLKAQMATLMQMISNGAFNNNQTPQKEETITVIHMIQCYDGLKTHIKLTNRSIDMSVIGETRDLTRSEAEEIASKYRKFFERGVLAFDSKNNDFAKKFDLVSCVSDGKINRDFVNYIADLNIIDLEKLFNSLGEAQKAFVVETFKRKIREGDARFNNSAKIQVLERLTTAVGELNGAMEGTLMDARQAAAAQQK